ncbi:MAG: hypothetical protein WAM72_23550 [Xanthobacteraceae bacterium]
MATRSLSPKQIVERTQRHRQAVMVLAHRRARKAVERQLQEQGLKPRYLALREIKQLAHDYLAQHREQCNRNVARVRSLAFAQGGVRKVPRNRTLTKRRQRNRRMNEQCQTQRQQQ